MTQKEFEEGTYEGELDENSLRDGYGILNYNKTNDWKNGSIYKGNWKNNKKHGIGILYWSNSNIWYEGNWFEDEKHGEGCLYYSDGKVWYKGIYNMGTKDEKGVEYWPNGNIKYDGQFKNNKYHGEGTQYHENGVMCYEGTWKEDINDGYGKKYSDKLCKIGSKPVLIYEGHIVDGEKDGYGVTFRANGKKQYAGYYKCNKKDGNGKIYYETPGTIELQEYDGDWKNDKKDGYGVQYELKGSKKYEGYWQGDKYHGKGKYYKSSNNPLDRGHLSEIGEWKNTKLQGYSRVYSVSVLNGKLNIAGDFGILEAGAKRFSIVYNKDGSIMKVGAFDKRPTDVYRMAVNEIANAERNRINQERQRIN